MNILINTSNLAKGGGLQVATSICGYLNRYKEHFFFVVLCRSLEHLRDNLSSYPNVKCICYSVKARDYKGLLTGRDAFLDEIVEKNSIDCVLSIFGPVSWRPQCPHVCGYALPHLVMPESPYYQRLTWKEKLTSWMFNWYNRIKFKLGSKHLFTENPLISERVKKMLGDVEVRTITNTYNQVFDNTEMQTERKLPPFDGITLLTVSAAYSHKNLSISLPILREWRKRYPGTPIRFVFTIDADELDGLTEDLRDGILTIGKVDISEVPSLYAQCDIVFQPSLLECFSAVYVEAMRSRKPLLVPDLAFVHGLCDDVACYYDATSSEDAVEKLHTLILDKELYSRKVNAGLQRLKFFDTSESRSDKLIQYCEEVVNGN